MKAISSTNSCSLMSDDDFRLLEDCIYRYCGIRFDAGSKYILQKRLSQRLISLNMTSFLDYYYYLSCDSNKDQEMMEIMDVLTTNETYFFRELSQFKAFTDEIIPELIESRSARKNRSLRIWSAGCSTGEEPYTISMLLNDIPELRQWDIEIIGTDISKRVLQHARRALYGKSSFRSTEDLQLKMYFNREGDGYRVKDIIRERVTISHLNLYDTKQTAMLGEMDVIFCRNVIIYFDLASKKRVVESFSNALHPGGYLLLGHSESLMNITTLFTLRHFRNDMIYQKPPRFPSGGAR